MTNKNTRNLVLSGLFIALGFVLPFLTMQIQQIGAALLPMHIPVLLCGFICGPVYGLAVGFITPLLRSAIMHMPPIYPIALAMAFELAAYGFLAGLFYKIFPKKPLYVYISLILSMLCGRIVWGLASLVLFGIKGNAFTLTLFIQGAFINAIPGIILQLVLIPLIILALQRAKFIQNN